MDETPRTQRAQRKFTDLPAEELEAIENVVATIIGSAIAVHSALGPGLLESVYEACLCHELTKRKLRVERQLSVPVEYDGVRLDVGFRIDLLVDDRVVVEIKSVEKLHPIHRAQVITYLRLADKRIGLLFNFNAQLIKGNFERIVN